MTPPRPAVALLIGLAVLAGCGRPRPSPPSDSGDGPKSAPAGRGTTPQGVASPQAPVGGPGPVGPQDPAQQAAEQFVADLRAAATPGPGPAPLLGRLTPDFLKVIGKPTAFAAEKEQGYSPSAAGGWLFRSTGALAAVAPPTGHPAGGPAVFVGSFDNGAGRYLLRLVPEGGGWKVDWFGLGTAKTADPRPAGPDEAAKEFAALAFLDALTAADTAQGRDDRLPLVAAAITPRLRNARAEPFGQDRDRGYDYNPAALGRYVDSLGLGGAEAYTRTPAGDGYAVSVTKGGAAKAFALKLVKDPARGWLVDEFTPQ
jgi:hypothetical protein